MTWRKKIQEECKKEKTNEMKGSRKDRREKRVDMILSGRKERGIKATEKKCWHAA